MLTYHEKKITYERERERERERETKLNVYKLPQYSSKVQRDAEQLL